MSPTSASLRLPMVRRPRMALETGEQRRGTGTFVRSTGASSLLSLFRGKTDKSTVERTVSSNCESREGAHEFCGGAVILRAFAERSARLAARKSQHVQRIHVGDPLDVVGRFQAGPDFPDRLTEPIGVGALHLDLEAVLAP